MPSKKTKQENKVEKDLMKVIGFFIFLVVLFIVASWFFKNLNHFDYEGLTFTKEKFGELTFYHYSYLFENKKGQITEYNLYLRTNPSANNVPVYAENDIVFKSPSFAESTAFITIDTLGLPQCTESFAAIGTLSKFLADNQITVKSGNMNESEASIQGHNYVTCDNTKAQNVRVIQIVGGNESRIDINGSCYTISVGEDCKIMQAIEKFELQTILDART
ncbi:hypothetical protein COU60_00385 [Candidatus Pacearchaeota archaeon CG10_big_fil_rev_8_21_14_0_10_34_76]|nr:MAG: hypothetical protein COU60_00385 [Candidatus Pacearchaeota archaeon CG10_big_fil_rev_8_21_14_0_10_34_76]